MKKDMNTLYFIQQFPDEAACNEHYINPLKKTYNADGNSSGKDKSDS
jgi:hypothetical protein